jgi:VWFA-related protein
VRRNVTVLLLASFAMVSVLAGPRQDPPPQTPGQLPPVFRGEVDLIRLDVSVLERDRRPVTGLTAADFTVIEDGVPQKIAAFSEVIVADRDPKPTAWMRHAGVDIATNDLVDQLGDGRPYAIVMDDWTIPADDLFLVNNARAAGREILSRLGPSDVAAVIFAHNAGRTVDFTNDRGKLMDAVNGFEGRHPQAPPEQWQASTPGPLNPRVPKAPAAPWGPGGLPPQGSDVQSRPTVQCTQERPLVPTLEVAARRLALIPNRRKSIVLVTAGTPMWRVIEDWKFYRTQEIGGGRGMIPSGGDCAPVRVSDITHVYAVAQQANINIYTLDVSDDQRFAQSVEESGFRRFLEDVGHYTGGMVFGANGESTATMAERVVAEAGSYYLLGYQSTHGAPDGKFRRLEVKVNRPYVTVRTRSGYFATPPGAATTPKDWDPSGTEVSSLWDSLITSGPEIGRRAPSASSLTRAGLYPPAGLPLRLHVAPVGLAATSAGRDMDVAVALSVRLPPTRTPVNETMTLIRQIYDPKGRPSAPVVGTHTFTVQPAAAGDETRYEFIDRLTLPPGRYELRWNARSSSAGRGGTVFTAIDVPDVSRAPVTLSGVILGSVPPADAPRTDALAAVVPVVPTSARSFAASDAISAFFHVFQGGTAAASPVTLRVQIINRLDQAVFDRTETLSVEAFSGARGVPQQIALPLAELTTGPYLLSVTAARTGGIPTRRDVRFDIR